MISKYFLDLALVNQIHRIHRELVIDLYRSDEMAILRVETLETKQLRHFELSTRQVECRKTIHKSDGLGVDLAAGK
jgi:hypothetical protein